MNPINRSRRKAIGSALACLAAPAIASPLDWIAGERIQGSGVIKKQTRELGHFSGLSLMLACPVELRLGAAESVTIEADDNVLPHIETVIEGGTLKIRRPARRSMVLKEATIRIVVQARQIERLHVGGSGTIDAQALRTSALQVDIGGSGSVRLRGADTGTLAAAIGGSGGLTADSGSAGKVTVSISGSGNANLAQLKANEASVNVAGSGKAVLNVRDRLSVTIAGSGDVDYYGDPKVSRTVAGSGTVVRLGPVR